MTNNARFIVTTVSDNVDWTDYFSVSRAGRNVYSVCSTDTTAKKLSAHIHHKKIKGLASTGPDSSYKHAGCVAVELKCRS